MTHALKITAYIVLGLAAVPVAFVAFMEWCGWYFGCSGLSRDAEKE